MRYYHSDPGVLAACVHATNKVRVVFFAFLFSFFLILYYTAAAVCVQVFRHGIQERFERFD